MAAGQDHLAVTVRCGGRLTFGLGPYFAGHPQAVSVVLGVPIDAPPLIFGEVHRADGEENAVLLVNHPLRPLQDGPDASLPVGVTLFRPGQQSQVIPDLIVLRPHEVGGTGYLIAHFQKGIEQVALLGIVDGQLPDLFQQRPRILMGGQLLPGPGDPAGQHLVLPGHGMQRMAGNGRQCRRQFVFVGVILSGGQLLGPPDGSHDVRQLRAIDRPVHIRSLLFPSAIYDCAYSISIWGPLQQHSHPVLTFGIVCAMMICVDEK